MLVFAGSVDEDPWRERGLTGAFIARRVDGLIVVDQHAAHERLVYERLKAALATKSVPRQLLLVPDIVDLPEDDVARLAERADELAELGLVIDAFGPGAVAVREIPALLGVTVVFTAMALFDGTIGRLDGLLLVVGLGVFIYLNYRAATTESAFRAEVAENVAAAEAIDDLRLPRPYFPRERSRPGHGSPVCAIRRGAGRQGNPGRPAQAHG